MRDNTTYSVLDLRTQLREGAQRIEPPYSLMSGLETMVLHGVARRLGYVSVYDPRTGARVLERRT